jgi:hypothetical protein
MSSVKMITLKTNHTLLCQIFFETDSWIEIKEPVQVISQMTKDGPMLAFSPFLEYSEEFSLGKIRINKSDILCTTTPVVDLANQYNTMFGSGIQIASSIPKR